jgi:hypothetical protein
MAKLIKFPGGEGSRKRLEPAQDRLRENVSVLKDYYEKEELEGVKFRINWRLLLEAQAKLSSLRQPSKPRELRVVSTNRIEEMTADDLIDLFNNSNEMDWVQNPSYWVGIYNRIIGQGINTLTE